MKIKEKELRDLRKALKDAIEDAKMDMQREKANMG